MTYKDIQAPLVGNEQVYKIDGSDTLVDLPTYLGYMNDNLNLTHGDLSPILISSVVGEEQTFPVATTTNTGLVGGIGYLMQPVVFPTAGTIQKTVVTTEKPGIITTVFTATMQCVVGQVGVLPMIGIRIEQQVDSGIWARLPGTDIFEYFCMPAAWAMTTTVHAVTLSLVHYFVDTKPKTSYRITALAGTRNNVALPATGQFKITAVNTDLEFHSWGN